MKRKCTSVFKLKPSSSNLFEWFMLDTGVLSCSHSSTLLLLQFMPLLTSLLTDSSQQSFQPSNPKSQVSLLHSNNPHSQSPSVSLADIRAWALLGSMLSWYSGAKTRVQDGLSIQSFEILSWLQLLTRVFQFGGHSSFNRFTQVAQKHSAHQ